MLRTGVRLLRRKARGGEERTMPVLSGLTYRGLTYTIFTEKAGERRGCCDPTRAALTSPGQRGGSPHPREIKGVGASRIAGQRMLKGAKGPGLGWSSPSEFLSSPLLTGCSLSTPGGVGVGRPLGHPAGGPCPRTSVFLKSLVYPATGSNISSAAGGM